ncbi:M56 family metallopeptidase [Algoriphagus resistens]|uniref:M56 family metallopeptidase n=1 Tax=Algoriphagus resistens TaxID=1750590 RepID=UPI000716AD44|nr:M56 family metallopeptidase [Algoriphagus resistens]
MTVYLLKFILCSVVLFTLFKLFLSREKCFQFNRIVLLLTIPLAAIAPLFSVPIEIGYPLDPVENFIFFEQPQSSISLSHTSEPFTPTAETTGIDWIVLSYLLIALMLLVYKSHSILSLLRWKNQGEKLMFEGTRIIISEKAKTPFSFLNAIFLNRKDYEKAYDLGVIISHEMAHISQKHYLDLLFLEFISVLFWFNPVCHVIKHQAKLNHEFLADQAILDRNFDINHYKRTLFKFSTSHLIPFTSPIVSSTLKLRMTMLNKIQNNRTKNLSLFASCFLGILTWGVFTVELQAQETKTTPVTNVSQDIPSTEQRSKAAKALDKLIEDATVIKTNSKGEEVRQFRNREGLSLQIYNLYKQLPESEKTGDRKEYGELINSLTKIPEKKPITQGQLEEWQDSSEYGIWIDGGRIENTILSSANPEDYSYYHISRLEKNAKNYGKHYYQVNLMTHAYFDETFPLLKTDK